MLMIEATEKTFSFGDFELSGAKRLLLKRGEAVALTSRTFDLLLTLVENHGRILSKDELLETVWEGQFVEENNLTVHISALRKIFGEKKDEHRFIVTIPGKGYKFVGGETSIAAMNETPKPVTKNFGGGEKIIGRDAEIAEIKTILRASDKCFLTLTGAGGSGKTTLARAVADELKREFADGVFFVELAAINQPEIFIVTLAKNLAIEESSAESLLETVKQFLQNRRILLVLDNFEQIISAAELLREIYDFAPNLKLLITSRAPLRLKFEREKSVAPLSVPPDLNFPAAQLKTFSAVQLFVTRAKAARANFVLNEENAPFVAEICKRLNGLPLAVELAAARVKLLSPQAIVTRLESSLKLLTGGAKDLPLRQQTMRGAIKWSYDLLDDDEKNLFRRLAVFAGGFTVEAAENIAGEETYSVLDLLANLIDNNLLVSREQPDGSLRLQMLETVREFSLECLETNGESELVRRVHARFFCTLAEEAEPFLSDADGREWLEKLEAEHDNFRVALGWSLTNDGETAVRMAAALRYFWLNHSHLSEGLRWSQAALQVTENNFSEARSKLLLSSGLFLRLQGKTERAQEIYEQALAESREINDLPQMIKANHGLAGTAVLQKDFAAAQVFYEEAIALSREANDEILTAHSLCALGDLELSKENLSAARSLLEECLTLSKRVGNKRLLTITHFNLGTIDCFENKSGAAIFNFNQTLRLSQELGHKMMISCALDGFAALAAGSGNYLQSAKLAGAADVLRETISYTVEPAEEIFREKYLTKTRAALMPQDFSDAYEAGRRLDFAKTIALTEVRTLDFSDDSGEGISEIIFETHQLSQIIIKETEN